VQRKLQCLVRRWWQAGRTEDWIARMSGPFVEGVTSCSS